MAIHIATLKGGIYLATFMYTMQYAGHSQQLIGIIPQISFNEFFDKVKNDKYDGENELKEIRSKFSKEILDNDKKCGVAIW